MFLKMLYQGDNVVLLQRGLQAARSFQARVCAFYPLSSSVTSSKKFASEMKTQLALPLVDCLQERTCFGMVLVLNQQSSNFQIYKLVVGCNFDRISFVSLMNCFDLPNSPRVASNCCFLKCCKHLTWLNLKVSADLANAKAPSDIIVIPGAESPSPFKPAVTWS